MTVRGLTPAPTDDLGPPVPFLSTELDGPDSTRRHSLPTPYLPSSIWSSNIPHASLAETGEAARGEHILDDATIAHRISALRQLNGATATRTNHRYAKSTGARNSTFSQPVIVRTYSGSRPASRTREKVEVRKEVSNGKAELPPLEAFTFKGIMDSIQSSVAEDLERIAEICARSRYSLSNQYEVHMPPHGIGQSYIVHTPYTQVVPGGGPTLQAIESDDEQSRPPRRRGARRVRSIAQGTLETIMSSSKSSDEEKPSKESAAALAEAVRGRAAKKAAAAAAAAAINSSQGEASADRPQQSRSRSSTFASIVIDSAQGFKADTSTTPRRAAKTYLLSSPAQPQTSGAIEPVATSFSDSSKTLPPTSPLLFPTHTSKIAPIRSDRLRLSSLTPDASSKPTVLASLSSWLPWGRPIGQSATGLFNRRRRESYAEGSLRELLKSRALVEDERDRKGKGIDRGI